MRPLVSYRAVNTIECPSCGFYYKMLQCTVVNTGCKPQLLVSSVATSKNYNVCTSVQTVYFKVSDNTVCLPFSDLHSITYIVEPVSVRKNNILYDDASINEQLHPPTTVK